jgi:predicted Zn-dependent protease
MSSMGKGDLWVEGRCSELPARTSSKMVYGSRSMSQREAEDEGRQSSQRQKDRSGKATRSSQGISSSQGGQGTPRRTGFWVQLRASSQEGEECEERREQGRGTTENMPEDSSDIGRWPELAQHASEWMESARCITVAGYKPVLEDGRCPCPWSVQG